MRTTHASGLWNAEPADLRALQRVLLEHLPHVITHTEAHRHVPVLAAADGYRLHAGRECAAQVRTDLTATARPVVLSPLPIPRRGGATCQALVLTIDGGVPAHTRIVVHLPSGVEGATGLRHNEQARVWRDCVRGLRRLVAATSGTVVIVGDWNLNLRRAWVRRLLAREFPDFTASLLPAKGSTHGRRWIDFTLSRGLTPTRAARSLPNPASDHRAVTEEHAVTIHHLPATLPATLRGVGLRVVELDGWHGRSRPESTGAFAPVGVLCHHTATAKTSSDRAVVDLLVEGRSDLPGPLCHFGLGRDGTVYVVASGRANHAGKAKASGTVAAGDGNALYIGIEAFNDGVGEPWPPAQYRAYRTLAAALTKHMTGNSVQTVRGHKETSVTGKVDPTFDMGKFRNGVKAQLDAWAAKPTLITRARDLLAVAARRREAKHPIHARAIRAALALLPKR